MDIVKLLDEMEELLESSPRIPMTGKVLVDAETVYDYIDRVRATLPEEIRQAKYVYKEKEKVLQDAQRQAEKVMEDARNHARKLVSETEIVRQAQVHAEEMVQQATKASVEMKQAAKLYANDILHQLEINLEKVLGTVKKGRDELQVRHTRD